MFSPNSIPMQRRPTEKWAAVISQRKVYVYLDTTRGTDHRHSGQALHRGRSGAGVRHQCQRDLWFDLVPAASLSAAGEAWMPGGPGLHGWGLHPIRYSRLRRRNKKRKTRLTSCLSFWCARRESNPHALASTGT